MSLLVNTRLAFLISFCKHQDLLNFLVNFILDCRLKVVSLGNYFNILFKMYCEKKYIFKGSFCSQFSWSKVSGRGFQTCHFTTSLKCYLMLHQFKTHMRIKTETPQSHLWGVLEQKRLQHQSIQVSIQTGLPSHLYLTFAAWLEEVLNSEIGRYTLRWTLPDQIAKGCQTPPTIQVLSLSKLLALSLLLA